MLRTEPHSVVDIRARRFRNLGPTLGREGVDAIRPGDLVYWGGDWHTVAILRPHTGHRTTHYMREVEVHRHFGTLSLAVHEAWPADRVVTIGEEAI